MAIVDAERTSLDARLAAAYVRLLRLELHNGEGHDRLDAFRDLYDAASAWASMADRRKPDFRLRLSLVLILSPLDALPADAVTALGVAPTHATLRQLYRRWNGLVN